MKTRRMVGMVLMVVSTVALMSAAVMASPEFTVVELSGLGGGLAEAHSINDGGLVVGRAEDDAGVVWAVRWDAGVISELAKPAGTADYSLARRVNEMGEAVGWNKLGVADCATVWDASGVPHTLGISAAHSYAESLNDMGDVVGVASLAYGSTPPQAAWHWDGDNGLTPLPGLGGSFSGAWDVNNDGFIVGQASSLSGKKMACLWDTDFVPQSLGVLGQESRAYGINATNEIVGFCVQDNGMKEACLFSTSAAPQPLGTMGGANSIAWDIGDNGWIVGWAEIDNGDQHAILCEGGMMHDLNDLVTNLDGWTLTYSLGVNATGQVVGYGTRDGETRAFLLNPVPEPATLMLLGSGLVGLIGMRRRRRCR